MSSLLPPDRPSDSRLSGTDRLQCRHRGFQNDPVDFPFCFEEGFLQCKHYGTWFHIRTIAVKSASEIHGDKITLSQFFYAVGTACGMARMKSGMPRSVIETVCLQPPSFPHIIIPACAAIVKFGHTRLDVS